MSALVRKSQISHIGTKDGVGSDWLVEHQSRRHLWCHLLYLDLHAAEVTGRQPSLGSSAWEDILPLNVRDEDILNARTLPDSSPIWTESTFTLIRMECYKLHRRLISTKQEIDQGHISLAAAITDVVDQELRIEKRYLSWLDNDIPIQRYAKLVGRTLLANLELVLLQERAFHGRIPPTGRTEWESHVVER